MATNEEMAIVNSANKKGKLERIDIEFAENGFMVSCSYRPPKEKKKSPGGCEPSCWTPPAKKVFETRESLVAFLQDALPDKPGGKSNDYDEDDE